MAEMIALFEQAYQKLAVSMPSAEEETSRERSSLCNNMAQYIPTTVEYTFTLLNSAHMHWRSRMRQTKWAHLLSSMNASNS